MEKAFISTLGCALSHKEGQKYRDYFTKNGWKITQNPSKADMIVLNLCSVNKTREEYHLQYIKKIKRIKNKNSKLIVVGCIAKISKDEVEDLEPYACIPPTDIDRLDEILKFDTKISEISERGVVQKNPIFIQLRAILLNNPFKQLMGLTKSILSIYGVLYKYINMPYEHNLNKKSYTITIATGCLNKCSYCAIRLARGKLKSVPSEDIVHKVKQAVEMGYKKIHLLGTNPCQYGRDAENEIDYYDLLIKIKDLEYGFKLVLPDFDPDSFVRNFDRMKKVLESKKIMEITFSLQSGSDKIIKAMNRYYNIEKFKEYFKEIRKIDPKIKLNSHILIGFPGEILEDFNKSFAMVKELNFDKVLLFDYGDRPGTASSRFPDHIPKEEIKRRLDKVNKELFFCFLRSFLRNQGNFS